MGRAIDHGPHAMVQAWLLGSWLANALGWWWFLRGRLACGRRRRWPGRFGTRRRRRDARLFGRRLRVSPSAYRSRFAAAGRSTRPAGPNRHDDNANVIPITTVRMPVQNRLA